jgi:hypothetical protein
MTSMAARGEMLTTTQQVQTATVATLVAGDSWLLKAGVPPRFIATSTSAANPTTWDAIFQLVPAGSTTLAQQFGDSDRGGNWLGRRKVEWSTMGTGTTTDTKLVIKATSAPRTRSWTGPECRLS